MKVDSALLGNRRNRPLKQSAAGHYHFVRSAIVLVMLCVTCSVSQAETIFQVSIGSYTQLDNARRALETANAELGGGHQVLRAETQQGAVYRVLSRPYSSRQEAQRAVAIAKNNNVTGAWIVRSQGVQRKPEQTSPRVS